MNVFPFLAPSADEFAPHFAKLIAAVPDGNIIDVLTTQLDEGLTLFRPLLESRGTFRYQADKWSIKDVLRHMTDCERVYTYRAMRIARGDTTPLPSFDEEAYAAIAQADQQSFSVLLDDFEAVRQATLTFLRSCDSEAGTRRGVASGMPVSVRALAYITAGHARHHLQILRDRYGL